MSVDDRTTFSSEEYQSRLTNLIRRNPVITRMMVAQTTRDDAIQHKEVTAGVHVRAGGKPGIT